MVMPEFINIHSCRYTEESMNFGSFKGGNGRRKQLLLLCNITDKFPSQAEGGKHVILSKILGWN